MIEHKQSVETVKVVQIPAHLTNGLKMETDMEIKHL